MPYSIVNLRGDKMDECIKASYDNKLRNYNKSEFVDLLILLLRNEKRRIERKYGVRFSLEVKDVMPVGTPELIDEIKEELDEAEKYEEINESTCTCCSNTN